MNAKTTKWIRIAGKTLLWTAAVFVAALLILPLWIGPVVKGAANSIVPGIVKTDFTLGEFGFNPYTGKLPWEMWLVTPALDYKNAAEQIFTFRVRGDYLYEGQSAALSVFFIDATVPEYVFFQDLEIPMPQTAD